MSKAKALVGEDLIKKKLIEAGIKNLKEFGYPGVNEKNILTDYIYRKFFLKMLEDEENITSNYAIEKARKSLIETIKAEKSDAK